MFDVKIKNHLELNFSSKYTKEAVEPNSLDVNNCLFTPELLTLLLKSNKNESTYFKQSSNHKRKVLKNREGIYLIAFRILNKEEKSLVYNYVYYNDHLYLTLIVYFMLRNHYITKDNHEWGKYLVVLDNNFLNSNHVDRYIDPYTKDKLRHKS